MASCMEIILTELIVGTLPIVLVVEENKIFFVNLIEPFPYIQWNRQKGFITQIDCSFRRFLRKCNYIVVKVGLYVAKYCL